MRINKKVILLNLLYEAKKGSDFYSASEYVYTKLLAITKNYKWKEEYFHILDKEKKQKEKKIKERRMPKYRAIDDIKQWDYICCIWRRYNNIIKVKSTDIKWRIVAKRDYIQWTIFDIWDWTIYR